VCLDIVFYFQVSVLLFPSSTRIPICSTSFHTRPIAHYSGVLLSLASFSTMIVCLVGPRFTAACKIFYDCILVVQSDVLLYND